MTVDSPAGDRPPNRQHDRLPRLVLFEPDIPQNTGTLMRMAACLGIGLDIIEPCGFVLDDRRLRRAAMDYIDRLDWRRFRSWRAYQETGHSGRLLGLTSGGDTCYTDFSFAAGDRLLVGRESAGLPADVLAQADARLRIPIAAPMRSLNVAIAAAMVSGEAIRQIAAATGADGS
ncbi:tRNA (cytidine(34)-2'-O)-methyltransferase [Fodinicurvata sp. EGI_FJ10296]|uniref:tRNA (cytidine(34)-2'-O)-methyltransferase n=1 Tax=Fodinicurvata sp. EGI_FJ10296 TaxID=3231908 RepID=UPI003456969B